MKLTTSVILRCIAADREGVVNPAWVKQKWGITFAQRSAFMRVQNEVGGFSSTPLTVKEVKDLVAGKKVRLTRLSDAALIDLKANFDV